MSEKLPAPFAHLQDLADRFAIGDDTLRGETLAPVTLAEKRALIARVNPHFEAINSYLDHHDDDSAHLLGRLAEAACEVQIEIAR